MKKFYCFLLICLFIVACANDNVQNDASMPFDVSFHPSWNGTTPADAYTYPIVPGSEKWNNLEPEEIDIVFRIPENILNKMSTQAIIQAIIDCPVLVTGIFSDFQYQWRFEIAFTDNIQAKIPFGVNAYMELKERKDAAAALLDRLLFTDPITGISTKPPFESQMVELLLSQTVFLSQVNGYADDIIRIVFGYDELRLKDSKLADDVLALKANEAIGSVLIGRTMIEAGYSPFVEAVNSNMHLKLYLDGKYPKGYWEWSDPEVVHAYDYYPPRQDVILEEIIKFAKLFLTK